MADNKISNDITTAVISVVLSLILIMATIGLVLLAGVKALISPKGLANSLAGIESETVVREYVGIDELFKTFEFTESQAERFLKTDTCKEIFGLYSKDINAVLSSKGLTTPVFTEENVQDVMVRHLDELTAIFLKGDEEEDEALKVESRIFKTIKNGTPGFVKSFPSAKELSERFEKGNYLSSLRLFNSKHLYNGLIITICVLCALIYLLRSYRFWGVLWLANNAVICAVVMLTLAAISFVGAGEYMLSGIIKNESFAGAAARVMSLELMHSTGILTALCIVLYVVYFKLKKHFYGKNKEN